MLLPIFIFGKLTSAVVQDFRSTGGLFSMSKDQGIHKTTVKDFFDRTCLRTKEDFVQWHKFMAQLREMMMKAPFSNTHGFLWVLHCKRKLQRIYTQNIDGLEKRVGISQVATPYHKSISGGYVPLHGSLDQLRCTVCHTTRSFSRKYLEIFRSGEAPACPYCISEFSQREHYVNAYHILV
jgi:NAD-dependent histone deacetylase SIR2